MPSVLFSKAILPLKPATIALKIGHLAFQVIPEMVEINHWWFTIVQSKKTLLPFWLIRVNTHRMDDYLP